MGKDIKIKEIYDSQSAYDLPDDEWKLIAEENEWDVDDDDLKNDYIGDMLRWDWEDLLDRLEEVKGICVVTGYFMSWRGPQHGGIIRNSLKEAVRSIIMDDSHAVIQFEDDLLVMHETHHDAPCSGNYYEFRILTSNGEKWYNNHKDDLSRQELIEHLTETKGYTKNVKLD